ncbi:TPA: hypothetical protein ACK0YS_001600, partial [Staphylococcus aureus]
MKKINDRDLAELSGYWAYQDLDKRYVIRVNNNKYRLIEDYSDNPNSKSFGGTDAKVFELVNSNNELTGQQAIIFQGTNNNKSIGSNDPFRGKVADDWIENIKLMNDKN